MLGSQEENLVRDFSRNLAVREKSILRVHSLASPTLSLSYITDPPLLSQIPHL